MFTLDTDALVPSKGTSAVTTSTLVYFTGFTLFSLGMGDFHIRAENKFLLLWSILCTGQGVFVVIVSVSYFCGALYLAAGTFLSVYFPALRKFLTIEMNYTIESRSLATMIMKFEPMTENILQNQEDMKLMASFLPTFIRAELQNMNDCPVLLCFLVNTRRHGSLIEAMCFLKTLVAVYEYKNDGRVIRELSILKKVLSLYTDFLYKQTNQKVQLDETLYRKLTMDVNSASTLNDVL
jgi:hypothetical protein